MLALLLIVVVGARVLGGARTPGTPTPGAADQTATIAAGLPPTAAPIVPTGGVAPGASGTPRPLLTPTRPPGVGPTTPPNRDPTPTAGPQVAKVMIANTDNKGAWLYVLPAGERRIAVPEGFILDVIGADERDTKGQNWKHIRYLDFEGWIPEEYTTPVQ